MGYHVELVASPPRPIPWQDLSRAGHRLGWVAHDKEQEIRLEPEGRLVARVIHGDGAPWCKTPDDEAMTALIALADHMGLRVRGDDLESYRSLDDWYIHRDDERARNARPAPLPQDARRLQQNRMWTYARIALLVVVFVGFGARAWYDLR